MIFDEIFYEASGVAATDNGGGVLLFTDKLGGNGGGGSVGGVFGFAEAAVPDDGFGVGNEISEFSGRKRAYI